MSLKYNSIDKIVVFRALQLGDMLCAIPAIRALRQAYPGAEICLIGLPWAKTLPERFPEYLDRFIPFPGYPGLPEQDFDPKCILHFIAEMQAEQFDLLLQMQGNGTLINQLMVLLGATHAGGFFTKGDYCPDPAGFLEYPAGIHESERHLRLMQHLGIPATDSRLEFPLYKNDREELEKLQLPLKRRSYVCVHPGSRGAWRQWPPVYFARLADECAAAGLQVVITGTRDEMEITSSVAESMSGSSFNVSGRTSLGAVACLIKDAALLISNCTGVAHIASALRTESVVISMDGESERWGAKDKSIHHTIDWTKHPDFEEVLRSVTNRIHNRMLAG